MAERGEVDDRQAPVAERDSRSRVDEGAGIVGTAMGDRVGHRLDARRRLGGRGRCAGVEKAGNAAHLSHPARSNRARPSFATELRRDHLVLRGPAGPELAAGVRGKRAASFF